MIALTSAASVVDPDRAAVWSRRIQIIGAYIMGVAPFAMAAAWRTFVHARKWLESGSHGAQGILEGAACGFAGAVVVLLPGRRALDRRVADAETVRSPGVDGRLNGSRRILISFLDRVQMTAKETVLGLLERLPEDFSLDDHRRARLPVACSVPISAALRVRRS